MSRGVETITQLSLERCGYVKLPGGEKLTSEIFSHGYLLASLAGRANQPRLEGVLEALSFNPESTLLDFTPPEMFIVVVKAFWDKG